jgi:hypothetical protein
VNAAYQTGTATNASESYSTTNAPKITVSGAHTVLVTVTFTGTTKVANSGCLVSFSGDNGSTINSKTIASLSDERAAGGGQAGGLNAGSRAEMAVTSSGTTNFQMGYRRAGASGKSFTNMSIIVQVF